MTSKNDNPDSLHVLAVEPFYGGSHRAFLDGVQRHSRHRWSVLGGKAVHWKWRMRSAPLDLSAKLRGHLAEHGQPDVVWCSDMLDLPQWLGFAAAMGFECCPSVVYFHESQWNYPQSPGARTDFHYGYTNLLSAIAADKCLFNSAFHRDEFFCASEGFLRRMPDGLRAHDLGRVREKSEIVYPGFEPAELPGKRRSTELTIGWVSRWEYDKRPDRFVDLLRQLREAKVDFRLILLGARPRDGSSSLETVRDEFKDQVFFDGFASTTEEYISWLSRIDIVVSTADHEYFGIAICEAIHAGAVAVVPDRLSYPEIVATPTRYESVEHAVQIIQRLEDPNLRSQWVREGQSRIVSFRMSETVAKLDRVVTDMCSPDRQPGVRS